MRLVILSDTHSCHRRLAIPEGDLLIHAGDMTNTGSWQELQDFNEWLGTLPHKHKIVIAGNHDFCWERDVDQAKAILTNGIYLEDSRITIEDINIWGTPWQPEFHDWAFNLPRGRALKEKWDLIPSETDILITHGPPQGHGDRTVLWQHVGCAELYEAVLRVKPRLHIFGHIHEGYGVTRNADTTFINASICELFNRPKNRITVLDW
jgi:Icc-related predicted phosphoesterase